MSDVTMYLPFITSTYSMCFEVSGMSQYVLWSKNQIYLNQALHMKCQVVPIFVDQSDLLSFSKGMIVSNNIQTTDFKYTMFEGHGGICVRFLSCK